MYVLKGLGMHRNNMRVDSAQDSDVDLDVVQLRNPKYLDSLSREKCEEQLQAVAKKGYHELLAPLLQRCPKVPNNVLINLLAQAEHTSDKNIDYQKCLSYVLKDGVNCDVNKPDSGLDTPLHYSVRYASPDTTLCLLKKGASLGNENRFGTSPIQEIDFGTLQEHFDNSIETRFAGINKIVILNFRTLIPTTPTENNNANSNWNGNFRHLISETFVLHSMSQIPELWPLLTHPLISSYLFIKWLKIRKFYYIQLLLYMIYYASLLAFIFLSYKENTRKEFTDLTFLIPAVPVVIGAVCEFLQIVCCPRRYFLHFENFLQLFLAAITLIIIFEKAPALEAVNALSASAIMLGAFKMMILLGRHPMMSTGIAMLQRVSCNFFKTFSCYIVLILAFALTFYKINKVDADEESSNNVTEDDDSSEFMYTKLHLTVIKMIVMLAGELDAAAVNYDSATNTLVFIMFVFLMTIILLNLLQGLAVCDTQQLKTDAEKIGIVKRIEYAVYVEDVIFGCISRRLRFCMARLICISKAFLDDYKMEVHINNNGKIKNNRSTRRRNVYLDRNTIRRIKQLLEERRKCEKTDEIERLQNLIREKDEVINNLILRANNN